MNACGLGHPAIVSPALGPPSSLALTARLTEGPRQDLSHCSRGQPHRSVGGHRGRSIDLGLGKVPQIKLVLRGQSPFPRADTCCPLPSCDPPQDFCHEPSRAPTGCYSPKPSTRRHGPALLQDRQPGLAGRGRTREGLEQLCRLWKTCPVRTPSCLPLTSQAVAISPRGLGSVVPCHVLEGQELGSPGKGDPPPPHPGQAHRGSQGGRAAFWVTQWV